MHHNFGFAGARIRDFFALSLGLVWGKIDLNLIKGQSRINERYSKTLWAGCN